MTNPLAIGLLEDNPGDARLIQEMLRQASVAAFRVDWMSRLEDLLERLERGTFDVLLLDLGLPDSQGLATFDRVHSRAPKVPIIIFSGATDEELAAEAVAHGAQDYLVKGEIDAFLLKRAIRYAIERQRGESEIQELLNELREAVRVRDTFLAIAAHELKTPVTALQLQIRLLQKSAGPIRAPVSVQQLEDAIEMIARQTTRLHVLIENFLNVVHMTSGRMHLDREPVDLRQVVSDIVAHDRLTPSGPEIIVDAQQVVGLWDRVRLESVIANLVSNAVKFGEGKPIRISVACKGSVARLVVTDQGIGIAPEEQARIFEKFERAVSERQYGGFGLGLWIVRQIVESHGGSIRVASEAGKGSTFVVELPLSLQTIA
jgi:signal transduction histidine kinase